MRRSFAFRSSHKYPIKNSMTVFSVSKKLMTAGSSRSNGVFEWGLPRHSRGRLLRQAGPADDHSHIVTPPQRSVLLRFRRASCATVRNITIADQSTPLLKSRLDRQTARRSLQQLVKRSLVFNFEIVIYLAHLILVAWRASGFVQNDLYK